MRRIAIALALTALLLLTACGQVEYTAGEPTTTPAQPVQEEQPVPQEENEAQAAAESEPQPQPAIVDKQVEQAETAATSAQPAESEKVMTDEPVPQASVQSEPVQNTPAEYPNVSPEPVQKASTPAEPTQAPSPEPATAEPAPATDTYSVEEAMRVGNEYAQTRYGVAIDTTMTAADSGYYPGTVESTSWLATNGGQSALNEAVCRNVDATFANLAARDGAAAVSAYATFSCTVRYDAGDYAIVILYG